MNSIIEFLNENFWLTAIIIASVTTPITSFINEKLKPNKVWKQVIAWLVSIVLVTGSYFLNVMIFNEPAWVTVPLTGLLVGLSANGIYDIPAVRALLNSWFSPLFKKK